VELLRALVVVLVCGCGRWSFEPVNASSADAPHLAVDAPVLTLDAGQCPTGYMSAIGSCYRVAAANGWLPGELACEADAVGAHLVVVSDDNERAMFGAQLGLGARTWIGTSKRAGSYLTVTGLVPFLGLGVQTEPSEDCLSIHGDNLMYLHTCSDSNPYVCEYDGVPAKPSAY